MNYQKFVSAVKEMAAEMTEKEVKVEEQIVYKNNGVIKRGVTMAREDERVYPTIYLEDYFREYNRGRSLESIVEHVIEVYRANTYCDEEELARFSEYSAVRHRILPKLIHYEKNADRLKEMPHKEFLDLAVVFFYSLKSSLFGEGSVAIQKEHMENWGVTTEELYQSSLHNLLRLHPPYFRNMEHVMAEMFVTTDDVEELPISRQIEQEIQARRRVPAMYVLSNHEKYFGSVYLCIHAILAEIAKQMRSDLYIIPSSVHECIVLSENEIHSYSSLVKMLREMNMEHVQPEEILSDKVYRYSRRKNKIIV